MARRATRSRAAAAWAIALALVVTSCNRGDVAAPSPGSAPPGTNPSAAYGSQFGPADQASPRDGGKLVFGIEAEPEGVDPTRYAFSSSGHMVASTVFDPLATLDSNAKPVPYLASAIDPSADFKTWTLTIPTGIQFHDDTPLNAQVVVDNFLAYKKSLITGADLVTLSSATAPDATHVVLTFNEPFVNLPAMLASRQIGYVVAEAMLNDPELANKPIGTGPFVYQSHVKDQYWSFTKNPHYRQAGLPHVDAIDIKPIPDNTQRLESLRRGDIDMLNVRSAREVLDLRQSNYKRVENSIEKDFLTLNTTAPPFDNPIARQAVAYATDAAAWRKTIAIDTAAPANGPYAPSQLGYLEDTGYPAFDLAKAKDLVAQYKTQTGHDLTFTLHTQADVNVQEESQLFQNMWQQAGMVVDVKALPQINLITALATGNYQMGRLRLFGSPSSDADASFFRASSIQPPPGIATNFPRFADPEIDKAISAAWSSTDDAVRAQNYQKVNRELAKNVPYIWLGRPVWVLAADQRVNGIYGAVNGTVQTIGPKTWLAGVWLGS